MSIEGDVLQIGITDKKEHLADHKYEFVMDGSKSGALELDALGAVQDTEPDISGVNDVVGL